MLELTRLGQLRIRQNEAFTDIHCEAVGEKAPAMDIQNASITSE